MMKPDERKLVVDYLRYMADAPPPPEIVERMPILGDPRVLAVGQSMLRSCAAQIETGMHIALFDALAQLKEEDNDAE